MLQPVAERGYPAFPAATITATGDGVLHGLRRGAKTFVASPFEQAMQKGARIRTSGESMDIRAAGNHLPGSLRIETLIVEELLCLWTLGRFITADAQVVAQAQGAVRGDPPVFAGLAFRNQRGKQGRFVLRWLVMLSRSFRHFAVAQRRTVLLQVLQPTSESRRLAQCCAATQQITQRRKMQHRAVVIATLEVRHPQPAGMLRPCQGYIKQAQVFRQSLIIGQGNQLGGRAQGHLGFAGGVVVMQRQAAAIHGFRRANERQEHQRIFKPLGLVDGHDLDQLLITFQTQDLLFAGLTGQRQMLGQMTDQRLFAIQLGGGLLQQFAKVQKVGQHPLAIAARDQCLGQLEVMQQAAQHGQHALLAPDLAIAAELHDPCFPGQFVLIESLQFRQRKIQRDAGQCGAQGAFDIRFGTCF
ncbi:hypothetical protein D3C87_1035600 [compost metagenome]